MGDVAASVEKAAPLFGIAARTLFKYRSGKSRSSQAWLHRAAMTGEQRLRYLLAFVGLEQQEIEKPVPEFAPRLNRNVARAGTGPWALLSPQIINAGNGVIPNLVRWWPDTPGGADFRVLFAVDLAGNPEPLALEIEGQREPVTTKGCNSTPDSIGYVVTTKSGAEICLCWFPSERSWRLAKVGE